MLLAHESVLAFGCHASQTIKRQGRKLGRDPRGKRRRVLVESPSGPATSTVLLVELDYNGIENRLHSKGAGAQTTCGSVGKAHARDRPPEWSGTTRKGK